MVPAILTLVITVVRVIGELNHWDKTCARCLQQRRTADQSFWIGNTHYLYNWIHWDRKCRHCHQRETSAEQKRKFPVGTQTPKCLL